MRYIRVVNGCDMMLSVGQMYRGRQFRMLVDRKTHSRLNYEITALARQRYRDKDA